MINPKRGENMDNFNVNFTNNQPQPEKKPVYDDLADLDPIVVNKSTMKASMNSYRKPVSNEVSFGPITSDRIMLVVGAMLVLSMFLPWASISVNFFGYSYNETLTQVKDNIFEAIITFFTAGLGVLAAVRHNKRYLISCLLFFAVCAGFVIKKMGDIRGRFLEYKEFFEVKYEVGAYLFVIAAILMVIAVILALMDKS